MPNTWDTYNGYIADKRKAGATLEEIGKEVGISRERVRQILMEHYGTTKMTSLLTTGQLSQLVGLTKTTVVNYRKRGIIKPANNNLCHPLYGIDAVEVISALRRCRICGGPLPAGKSSYCSSECHKEGDRRSRNRSSWRTIRKKKGVRVITPSTEYKK